MKKLKKKEVLNVLKNIEIVCGNHSKKTMDLLNFIAQCEHDTDFDKLNADTQTVILLTAEDVKEQVQDSYNHPQF